jgi:hypothetical protein
MKTICVIICLFLLTCNAFPQGNSTQTGTIKYIPVDTFNSNNRINIVDVEDYVQLLNSSKITTVFTFNNMFIFEYNSILYTLPAKGYKTLNDYAIGKSRTFTDGSSYYLALEFSLKTQEEVDTHRADLKRSQELGFLSLNDYRDAVRTEFINSDIQKNFSTVAGLIRKNDLQRLIYYLNVLLGVDKNNMDIDIFLRSEQRSETTVRLYSSNYYYISLSCSNTSRFYYACKLAQYTTLTELLENNKSNNSNNRVSSRGGYMDNFINIKNTETIYKELRFENYTDCVTAIIVGFQSASDYYLAKKYRIDNDVLTEQRGLINELERIKQTYNTDKNEYAALIYYILKRRKGIPVALDVFCSELTEEYKNTKLPSIYFHPTFFETVYNEVEKLRSIVVYDPNGKSFYLK